MIFAVSRHMSGLSALILLGGACLFGCSEAREKRNEPVTDAAAAALAFRLYYKERVDRALVACNRFMLFGDVTFGVTLGKAGIERRGDEFEVVPGPNDNNMIGLSVWTVYQAYHLFRTRTAELTLLRMLNGLRFFEAVSGHPGLTARMVYPGWTRVVDGPAGTVERSRSGAAVEPAESYSPNLEGEMIDRFWGDVRVVYREDPADILFHYMPAMEVGPYAVTYSFSALPAYLRSSDCCASLMRTPAPHAWEGAYWGNHNSRDNFPDLALGLVAAMAVADDRDASEAVRQAAREVVAAGQRIGDTIVANDALMTVGEHQDYDTLIPSGGVRPDGEVEIEDLGTLADCQMAFLARALSSSGLQEPLPPARAPSSIEYILVDALGGDTSCEVVEDRVCTRLEEAFCGEDWSTMEQMTAFGSPWLDLVRTFEESSPGMAEELIGGFQDDFYEITLAVTALIQYAQVKGDADLTDRARAVLGDLTHLMRVFAEIIYTRTRPDRLASRLYEAALFDAWAGLPSTPVADLQEFTVAETHLARLESWLQMADTEARPLLSDAQIQQAVEDRLAGRSETVKARYAQFYGDTPPIRRAGDAYEARGVPLADHPWTPIANPTHRVVGGVHLLGALPLCRTAPQILDCTWAAMGCARPDLDGDGVVDGSDRTRFESGRADWSGASCGRSNDWCAGLDLDRTGRVDSTDADFMQAAQGCHYSP